MYIDGQNNNDKISAEIMLANKKLVGVCSARFFKIIFNNIEFPIKPNKTIGTSIIDLYTISLVGLSNQSSRGKSYLLKSTWTFLETSTRTREKVELNYSFSFELFYIDFMEFWCLAMNVWQWIDCLSHHMKMMNIINYNYQIRRSHSLWRWVINHTNLIKLNL